MIAPPGWSFEHVRGSAAAFHDRDLPDPAVRAAWWFEVERPAIVLGSTQGVDEVDAELAARRGVEVARRRSGGGAVWLAPGEATWVDVVIPRDDPRWDDDVVRSSRWLGEAWAAALAEVAPALGAVEVHEGRAAPGRWGRAVCFAGRGPGEVLVGDRKVVGLAQRRTRAGARFQCALLHRWDPAPLRALLPGVGADADAALAGAAQGVDVAPADAVAALLRHLPPA